MPSIRIAPPEPAQPLAAGPRLVKAFLRLLDENMQALLRCETTTLYEIADLADHLHVHPKHLSQTVKQETGRSACDFLNERIVSEAKVLLRDTPLSVKEIAYLLTFQEATNFTKYFKRHVGVTPTEFRAQIL